MATEPEPVRERKSLTEIADRLPALPRPGPKSFLEWSGTVQMAILLTFICALAAVFLVVWGVTRPTLEDVTALVSAGGAEENAKAATPEQVAEMMSSLQRDHFEQCRNLFQIVVLSALVPLFTLLAGYVFGKGRAAGEQASEGESEV